MQFTGAALDTLVYAKPEAAGHGLPLQGYPARFDEARAGVHPADRYLRGGQETAHLRPHLAGGGVDQRPALIAELLDTHLLVLGTRDQWGRPRHFEFTGQQQVVGDRRNRVNLSQGFTVGALGQRQDRHLVGLLVIL